MSAQLHGMPVVTQLTAEQRALLERVARNVAGAARFLVERHWTELPASDLEALGLLAAWRRLPEHDPGRGGLDRWAFYTALYAMLDASRAEQRENALQATLRRGARAYVAQDDRPVESDFHADTPATDRARLSARVRTMAVSALVEVSEDPAAQVDPISRRSAAIEAVLVLREEVARLAPARRRYVHLRFWDAAEVEAAALAMGVPERTLRRRWAETRDLLRARLRARGVLGVADGLTEALDLLDAQAEQRAGESSEPRGGSGE